MRIIVICDKRVLLDCFNEFSLQNINKLLIIETYMIVYKKLYCCLLNVGFEPFNLHTTILSVCLMQF